MEGSGQGGGSGGAVRGGGAATNDIEDLVRSNKRGRGKPKSTTVKRGRRDAPSREFAKDEACSEDNAKGRWAGVVLTLVAAVGVVSMVYWRIGWRSRGR